MRFQFLGANKDLSDTQEYSTTTKEFEADSLDDILEEFQQFLSGCGFVLKGNVEIGESDENL